jgi:predicted ATP-dependent endonuclease of OLD family
VFARKALLTEGYGDRIAALLIAEKLDLDLDAEGVVIVDCGGKAGIELVLLVCRALGVPFVVLHDADIRQTDDISDPEKRNIQEQENEAEQRKNNRIKAAAGNIGRIYVIRPSLEEVLGIARDASDKPRRIAEALGKVELADMKPGLDPLIEAVKELCCTDDSAARAGSVTGKEGLTP